MKTSDINTKTKEGRLLVAAIQQLSQHLKNHLTNQEVLDLLWDRADLEFEPAEEDKEAADDFDDENDFECCDDCDLPDACADFGCAIKLGVKQDPKTYYPHH